MTEKEQEEYIFKKKRFLPAPLSKTEINKINRLFVSYSDFTISAYFRKEKNNGEWRATLSKSPSTRRQFIPANFI